MGTLKNLCGLFANMLVIKMKMLIYNVVDEDQTYKTTWLKFACSILNYING